MAWYLNEVEKFLPLTVFRSLVNVIINSWTQYTNELGVPCMRYLLLIDIPERLRGCHGNPIKHTTLHSYCNVCSQQSSRSRHTTKKDLWATLPRRMEAQCIDHPYDWRVKMWNLHNSNGGWENGLSLLVAAARCLIRWCRIGSWTP
jgi:hypothetical protein